MNLLNAEISEITGAIKAKKIQATAMQFPQVIAETAASYADEYFKGKRDFPHKVPVAVELVTQKNVGDFNIFTIPETSESCALGVSKKHAHLLAKIQTILDQFEQDGTIKTLKTKWKIN